MKKLLLIIISLLTINTAWSQTLIVYTGFDNYNGSISTVPAGWVIGWNASNSFYTSAGNFGVAAPSYKFGNDSDYVVAPMGIPGMDSVSFFVKGNGTPFSPLNELRLFQSADSVNWSQVAALSNLPTTGTTLSANLNGDPYLMFVYHKEPAGGNIAFDDVMIYTNTATGLTGEVGPVTITVFPTPSAGLVFITASGTRVTYPIETYDLLGNRLKETVVRTEGRNQWSLDLSGLKKGVYFIRVQTEQKVITRRITLTD
jgi:hypothetical protein